MNGILSYPDIEFVTKKRINTSSNKSDPRVCLAFQSIDKHPTKYDIEHIGRFFPHVLYQGISTGRSHSIIESLFNREILFESFSSSLNEYKNLDHNWDGYNAEKPSLPAIEYAKKIIKYLILHGIKNPFLYPMRNGGVQIEFQEHTNNFEIEINPDKSIILLVFDNQDNLIREQTFNEGEFVL